MAKGSRRDQGKTKTQRKEQIERKRDERAQRNALKKNKQANNGYGLDDGTFKSFRNQLQAQGLKMRDVNGDGNCLFRALADQLDGDQNMHGKHRKETVQYMKDHEEDFVPFLEETITFEKYLKELASQGTYGGNDSIVAFARKNNADIIIHQHNNPTFIVEGSESKKKKLILHLAYHDFEHYSSVRRENDPGTGPAYMFHDEKDSIASRQPPLTDNCSGNNESDMKSSKDLNTEKEDDDKNIYENQNGDINENGEYSDDFISEAVRKIQRDSGHENTEYIRNAFVDNMYDEDATLSFILQTMTLSDANELSSSTTDILKTQLLNDLHENHQRSDEVTEDMTLQAEKSNCNDTDVVLEDKCVEDSVENCNEEDSKATLSKCSCKRNEKCDAKCSCDEQDGQRKEKENTKEGKKKQNKSADRTVKKPTNRQRKELAKQARKKRRQESRKDSHSSDTQECTKIKTSSSNGSIQSINI